MAIFSKQTSRTFDEYLLLQRETKKDVRIEDVSLESRISNNMKIPVPFLSAAMQCVSGDEMGIALASQGGLAVIPCGTPTENQVDAIKKIKKYRAGFVVDVISVSPYDKIQKLKEIEEKYGYSTFPVVEGKKLVGLITKKKYHPHKDLNKEVKERMIPLEKLKVEYEGISLEKANKKMFESGIGVLPIIDKKGYLESVVFWEDIEKHMRFPNAFVDKDKRLMTAAAISTQDSDIERAQALIDNGIDFIFVDASHGYSEYQKNTIQNVKKLIKKGIKDIPVWGGNVVDKDGFNYLVEAGADGIKIGQGPGASCITRRVKSSGRGQATAVIQCAEARDDYFKRKGRYIPICADGGIETTGQMAIAFALGTDLIMMGKYFGGFKESPSSVAHKRALILPEQTPVYVPVKPYWGEASAKAKNIGRYGHKTEKTFVIEGEEGYIPFKGNLEDGFPKDLNCIKGILASNGCKTIKDFHKNAKVELQSEKSYVEGGTNIIKA